MGDTLLLKKIIDGQSAMHTSLLSALSNELDDLKKDIKQDFKKVEEKVDGLGKKVDNLEKKVDFKGKRLDRIGRQLAYLEDDAPTKEEFDGLEQRVTKVEEALAVA